MTRPAGLARRLRGTLGFVVPPLVEASERVVSHPRIAELYPAYLATMHGVIRASVPLMETARDRASALAADDRVAAGVAAYLESHIPEERGHDEWLLDDLAVLGHDRADVLARMPSPAVATFVGVQYYWVLHHDPVAVLGYIAVLEGYPPSKGMVDGLVARSRHPRKAFRTMLAHSVLDPRHRDDFDAALDALPMTEAQEATVRLSALSSARMLTQTLHEVVESAERRWAAERAA